MRLHWLGFLVFPLVLSAQDASTLSQDTSTQNSSSTPAPSVAEKWDLFEKETVAPFTLGAGAFNAAVSQITRSAPLYGRHPWPTAYPKRFGASIGDIVSQNFFGDFVLASAFHEDTRYVRRGSTGTIRSRIFYAISRSVITRTDAGGSTFNWANVLGTAMSAGLSNAYYPPVSRTAHVAMTNWSTSVAGSGLANLMPEFWPDFSRWVKKHLPKHR